MSDLTYICKQAVLKRLKSREPLWGGWYIADFIGAGTYGCVFKVEKKALGTMESALKVIPITRQKNRRQRNTDTLEASVGKDAEEIMLLYQLSGHTNLVTWHDHEVFWEREDDAVTADIVVRTDYLPNSLSRLLENGPMPPEKVCNILIDCLKGLDHIHTNNIIHRDIKPENIFITETGSAKIGDFGVARRISESQKAKSYAGTPLYMAPEVLNNPHGNTYDHRADIYSLGLVGYEMLEGQLPFEKECKGDESDMIECRMTKGIQFSDNVNPAVKDVILKALSINPEDRFSSARIMELAVKQALHVYGKGSSGKGFEQEKSSKKDKEAKKTSAKTFAGFGNIGKKKNKAEKKEWKEEIAKVELAIHSEQFDNAKLIIEQLEQKGLPDGFREYLWGLYSLHHNKYTYKALKEFRKSQNWSKRSGLILGIDFGTSNSCVAVMAYFLKSKERELKVITNSKGKNITPSIISISENHEAMAGDFAKWQSGMNPQNSIFGIKRLIGKKFDSPEIQENINLLPYMIEKDENGDACVNIQGKQYHPVELAAYIFEELKYTAVETLEEGKEEINAIFSIPVSFDRYQIGLIKKAAKIAGLNVLRIFTEPTLASIGYNLNLTMSY